jgi:hypothetical protein
MSGQRRRHGRVVKGVHAAIWAVILMLTFGTRTALATSYPYQPGMTMIPTTSWHSCTGGYIIHGGGANYDLTAGHCWPTGMGVSLPHELLGYTYANGMPTWDTQVVTHTTGLDSLQTVIDPVTGTSPGTGKVTGYYQTSQLWNGMVVGKMGATTGWTEGPIVGTRVWNNSTLSCSTATAAKGDSGGPVWRWESTGIKAIGISLDSFPGPNGGPDWDCFMPIDEALWHWNATLPVWPPGSSPLSGGAPLPRPAGSFGPQGPRPANAQPVPPLDANTPLTPL